MHREAATNPQKIDMHRTPHMVYLFIPKSGMMMLGFVMILFQYIINRVRCKNSAVQVPFKKNTNCYYSALREREREIHNAGSELGNL